MKRFSSTVILSLAIFCAPCSSFAETRISLDEKSIDAIAGAYYYDNAVERASTFESFAHAEDPLPPAAKAPANPADVLLPPVLGAPVAAPPLTDTQKKLNGSVVEYYLRVRSFLSAECFTADTDRKIKEALAALDQPAGTRFFIEPRCTNVVDSLEALMKLFDPKDKAQIEFDPRPPRSTDGKPLEVRGWAYICENIKETIYGIPDTRDKKGLQSLYDGAKELRDALIKECKIQK